MRTCATAHGRAFLTIPTCAAAAPATQVDAFNLASFTVQSEPRRGLSNSFRHCTCEGLAFSILHNVTYFPGKLLIIETFVHSITIDGWDVQQIQSSTIETIKKWCQCIWSVATQTWIWSISYYRMIEKLFVFFPLLALSPGGRNWWQIFANPNQDNFQTACIHAVRRKM